jgi:hypothetical protein
MLPVNSTIATFAAILCACGRQQARIPSVSIQFVRARRIHGYTTANRLKLSSWVFKPKPAILCSRSPQIYPQLVAWLFLALVLRKNFIRTATERKGLSYSLVTFPRW